MIANASPRRPRAHRAAVTLIELIVVLVILAGLGSVVIPRLANDVDETRETTTRASLAVVRDATIQYWSDCKYLIADAEVSDSTFGVRIDDLLRNPFDDPSTTTVEEGAYDPSTGLGWRGPYLASLGAININDGPGATTDIPDEFVADSDFNRYFRTDTGSATQVDPVLDSWGTPIVIQDVTAFDTEITPELGEIRQLRVVSAGPGPVMPNNAARKNAIEVDYDPAVADIFDDPNDNIDDVSLTFEVR